MIDDSAHLLDVLQAWYRSNCNGDWEHEFGIKIENIDNPGWTVSIPLADTSLELKPFAPLDIRRDADNWLLCRVEDKVFRGDGGSGNLTEIIRAFVHWIDRATQG